MNNTYANYSEVNFSCSAQTSSILNLENITFHLWNSSGEIVDSSSVNISGDNNQTNFSFSFLDEGVYSVWDLITLMVLLPTITTV